MLDKKLNWKMLLDWIYFCTNPKIVKMCKGIRYREIKCIENNLFAFFKIKTHSKFLDKNGTMGQIGSAV